MKKQTCDLCKKEISKEEVTESCMKLRKAMQPNNPGLFDIWFRNYCAGCADDALKYMKGEIREL